MIPPPPPNRSATGRFVSDRPAIERFKEKCRFDPTTGCVLWTGGTTAGRGNSAVYGSFWFEGRRWFAHRWAAIYVHGIECDGVTVGHCCPHTGGKPNTLCVEHLRAETLAENVAERNTRVAQTNAERRYWLFVRLGLEEPPPVYEPGLLDIPFYEPPTWLGMSAAAVAALNLSDCPF